MGVACLSSFRRSVGEIHGETMGVPKAEWMTATFLQYVSDYAAPCPP